MVRRALAAAHLAYGAGVVGGTFGVRKGDRRAVSEGRA